ncbi:protein translocase subunit SecD [Bradyrhizobium erythrophlei]|uniref:Protein translocase subunit SecD n=1 Tax=Bradyrhizobium erythrophlei TaxID=1437360 RepID=A0A1M7UT92_9BRAD|nr:protein translocase subunit SecD [Bradyrhizobium erythrophlei]SHN86223.1 preprotein translocase subunit SecD [Bradyrhizobium erythrophlei]
MLYFTRWKALAIILTALVVCLCAVPNFFPEARVKTWPLWAQRHLVLGLDLQGGSYLLLEVDSNYIKKTKLDQIRDDARRALRDAKIRFSGGVAVRGDAVEARISEPADVPTALSKLRELSQPLGGLLGSNGQRSLEVTDAGNGLIRLTVPPAAITERIRQTIEQSIQIVEKRVNELGTVEPVIQRQGTDRILVQVPGLQDPTRLKILLGQTANMEFRMVDETVAPDAVAKGTIPQDDELVPEVGGQNLPLKKQVLVSGGDLSDAQTAFDQRSGEPVVSFKFNSSGARKFAQATTEGVGQRFAIVLDNKVISAPVIREPIIGGQGQISGNFTVQSANDLAILLRAGALPAPLTVIEERTVGPGLGQDSIEKGELAAYVGSILVIVFMLVTYRLFGLFANIAVAINVAMIFGVLSLLNATLTLPGIAGIVLTVGIAVDSNVLIYERIREEIRGGRNAISAIDAGFKRALATILDSNITTFIAAAVLFYIGTGPVRGFAVTLGIGILTTVFTAFTLTRLIVAWWVRWKRPQSVPI